MTDETVAQNCVACGQGMVLDDYWHCEACGQVRLQSDYWQRKITYWQDLAVANRKVAEDAQAQRDKLAVVLKWLDAAGNLGLDKHARIREALKP